MFLERAFVFGCLENQKMQMLTPWGSLTVIHHFQMWEFLWANLHHNGIKVFLKEHSVTLIFISHEQKYSRLRCLLRVKGLVICFYLGWSGSILQFKQNMIKVGCSSNITLSLPSYTGSALKRELNFCNGYLSLLYFWAEVCSFCT